MSAFIYNPIDIQDGIYVSGSNPVAVDLNQTNGWTALQAMLADKPYRRYGVPQQVDRPIDFVAVDAHGAALSEDANSAFGIQGPGGYADNQVSQFSLRSFGFDRSTNAVALAIFTGCKIGDGPFMRYLLRDKGLWHQISAATATSQHIRPCFGLGWAQQIG